MLLNEPGFGRVFHFFSEISKIPHGSGNTAALAEYCLDFAKKRGLEAYRDGYGNVMIFKDKTNGFAKSESVILQGHLDMVCEKRPDCGKDMEREGIDLVIDGEYLRAEGTTLGGDDGIAIAYILAILDSDEISHPPIEALFTADEETGLVGAAALDVSRLKGKRLINIDSEEEGALMVSCAGAVRVFCRIPVTCEKSGAGAKAKKITVGGLLGGHSGIDIGKNRKNAAAALAELLYELKDAVGIRVAEFCSGGRVNVIPPTAHAVILIDGSDEPEFDARFSAFSANFSESLKSSEPNAFMTAEDIEAPDECLDRKSSDAAVSLILLVPDGVSAMSADIPFLVETSSNLGSVSIADGAFELGLMIRSNTEHGKKATLKRLKILVEGAGGSVFEDGDYPAWEYSRSSPLRDVMIRTYKEMYGTKPRVCAIHAGLECGILAEKLGGADMISIGPNMQNVHTPDERLEIRSVQRCWEFLLRTLENLK